MKNFKYLFFFIVLGFVVPSCVDDTAPEDAFGQGPNLASFSNNTLNFSVVATGEEYVQEVPMKVKGPSLSKVSSPVTATISVDPSSTAVEGVHFRLDQNTIQISPDNNFLGKLPVTVLTAGIDAPLAEAPVLVLRVSDASGADNVIANGRKVSINLNYLCDSNLQGSYTVTIVRNDGLTNVFPETIVKTGSGEYRGTAVGHYAPGSLGGTPGFTFLDVCNVITVPEQNLVDLYSNLVYGISASSADPVTGTLTIKYEITFAAGNRQYTATYVKL